MARVTDLDEPAPPNGKEVLTPGTRDEWREWLAGHPDRRDGLWLVYRKKSSDLDGPSYDDLVEEALCFGWIDSQARRVDDHRMMQWFSPRRKGGLWSASNKERIEMLTTRGLIASAGWAVIDQAKADGSWSQTDEVDALVVPADLAARLDAAPAARAAYTALTDSAKRRYLWWIHTAKRPDTRAHRVEAAVDRLLSGEPAP
jgi:uncharacterized protein YdeI (YjbR/CyaY-like superfamily)